MPGRPRKPTVLKMLAGNPGKRPLPDEREVEHRPAVKPKWIDADPAASSVWDEYVHIPIRLGLLTDLTQEAFAQLCDYIAENRAGTLDGPKRSDMRHLRGVFGLDPAGLAKLGIATPKKDVAKKPFASLA